MNHDLFELAQLWPIYLDHGAARGHTLWGGGGEEADLVLAHDGAVLLFPDQASLLAYVRDGLPCNMGRLPGYERLRSAAPPWPDAEPVPYLLSELIRFLEAPRWRWSEARCTAVLDGLNLLWDLAGTLGEDAARERLRAPAPLGVLADTLTFVGPGGLRAQPLPLPARQQAARDLREILARLLPAPGDSAA